MKTTTQFRVNYYYDDTADRSLTSDTEGNLVQLCDGCAGEHRAETRWAQRGHETSSCELCDEPQAEMTRQGWEAVVTW